MAQSDKKDPNNNNKPIMESSCHENFRLFSYLAMAILSIAIIVGMFIIFQHLEDEKVTEKTIANQEDVLKNQKLLLELNKDQANNQENIIEIINITNRDNAQFFDILDNMTNKLNLILDQGIELDKDTNKKIDKIMKKLRIYRDLPNNNNMTLS